MANSHAAHFKQIEDCEIVACSDRVPGRAAEFAARHGIASAYDSNDELLDKEQLDGVSVVTNDDQHKPVVLQVCERGLHVMCEKPLSTDVACAKEMVEAAKAKGLITAVNFSYRNSPATQKAAELVAAGAIGRVIHVEGAYLQSWIPSKCWGDWHTTEAFLWRMSARHGSLGGWHIHLAAAATVGNASKEVDGLARRFALLLVLTVEYCVALRPQVF